MPVSLGVIRFGFGFSLMLQFDMGLILVFRGVFLPTAAFECRARGKRIFFVRWLEMFWPNYRVDFGFFIVIIHSGLNS